MGSNDTTKRKMSKSRKISTGLNRIYGPNLNGRAEGLFVVKRPSGKGVKRSSCGLLVVPGKRRIRRRISKKNAIVRG